MITRLERAAAALLRGFSSRGAAGVGGAGVGGCVAIVARQETKGVECLRQSKSCQPEMQPDDASRIVVAESPVAGRRRDRVCRFVCLSARRLQRGLEGIVRSCSCLSASLQQSRAKAADCAASTCAWTFAPWPFSSSHSLGSNKPAAPATRTTPERACNTGCHSGTKASTNQSSVTAAANTLQLVIQSNGLFDTERIFLTHRSHTPTSCCDTLYRSLLR